jgi:hypothetical protein
MKGRERKDRRYGHTNAILVTILVVSALILGVHPSCATTASVTRDFTPLVVQPNVEFDVTLTQTNFFFGVGIVTETLPSGFTYIAGSYTGGGPEHLVTYDPVTRKLTAEMAFVDEDYDPLDSVTYRVRASSFDQIGAQFAGKFVAVLTGGGEPGTIGGDKEINVDGTAPYTDGYNPANSAMGVPVDTNIVVHVRDNYAVDPNTIVMTVNSVVPDPARISKMPITLKDWQITYDPLSDFGFGQTIVVTITATDYAGNAMPTPDFFAFTTTGPPDTTAPVISSVASSGITHNAATITWTTNEIADSLVKYGTTSGAYTLQQYNAADVTSHSVGLTGLNANTMYYYVVNSTDPSNNPAQSAEFNFTTLAAPDTTAPVISTVAHSGVTQTTATITWTTNEIADSLVKYGTAPGVYTLQQYNAADVTSHSVGLTGLEANRTYYYVVNSTDPSNNPAQSTEFNFKTLETAVLPRWDINEDCTVNYLDLGELAEHWGETTSAPYPRYDINEDGVVNYLDLGELAEHWGETTC